MVETEISGRNKCVCVCEGAHTGAVQTLGISGYFKWKGIHISAK